MKEAAKKGGLFSYQLLIPKKAITKIIAIGIMTGGTSHSRIWCFTAVSLQKSPAKLPGFPNAEAAYFCCGFSAGFG